MSLQELFDYLLEHKSCKLRLKDGHHANSLRTSLSRKWAKEKNDRNDLGFLTADVKYLAISMDVGPIAEDMGSQEFTFHLRPRSRSKIEYEILPASDDTP